jgi:uncharacterized membrane protein
LSDTSTHDDAPNATSKHLHGDREVSSRAVTINRPAEEVYAFYRDPANAASWMDPVANLEVIGDVPGSELTWRTADSSGRTTFETVAGRGTVVTLTIAYDQSFVGKIIDKVTQRDPAIEVRRDLRRLKQLLETGEIATKARNQRMLVEENQ